MVYCPKCGTQVDEAMAFCPRCGASLKVEAPVQAAPALQAPRRSEKSEKHEKGEKHEKQEPEKGEKHEKGEYGIIGWFVGGFILILIGVMSYARATGLLEPGMWSALVLLVIGVVIIFVAIYIAITARRRHPPPA